MFLRRRSQRVRAESDSAVALQGRPGHERENSEVERLKEELEHTVDDLREKQNESKLNRHFYASRRFIFPLGIIVGILLGFILIQPSDFTDFQTHLALLLDEFEWQFDMPQLPQFDLSVVENEWRRLKSSIPEFPEPWKLATNGLEFTVGESIAARGLSAGHPVVLVPGVISTGLESWSTAPTYRPFFRQKMWGGFSMLSQVTFNREKWMNALLLDPDTGLDPPGAKVRAAEGIDAASSFVQGYWLWAKIVENLAVVNYDTNNLHLAPYDWRLSYYNLEVRDSYFSKLKTTIEGFKKREGKRVVLVAHSMGATILLYFFKWVESPLHGDGGSDWVENNIEAMITIGGTYLGVTKSMAAFLSGEMKDTVQMNPAGAYVLERFFSRRERKTLFHSWPGSASMWVKGGDAVWGNSSFAPDDIGTVNHTHGELVAFREPTVRAAQEQDLVDLKNLTVESAGSWILERTPKHFQKMMATNYSLGIERDEAQLKKNNLDHRKWTNPLEIQLPNAPTTKFYCVYGHGKETERSYFYAQGELDYDDLAAEPAMATSPCDGANMTESTCHTPLSPLPMTRKTWIDSDYTDESASPRIVNGVKIGEGDGTVSLLSLGAMCVEGWKHKRWNPAGIKVVTVEVEHKPSSTIPRGGGTTADHVDILGNTAVNELILKVATGVGDEVQDAFVSDIRDYAQRIQWD